MSGDFSAAPAPRVRIDSVDFLRGLVIVIMALDHVRDFTSNARFDPLDPEQTNLALYLTRWVTNFCAPVFIFLAGASAGFQRHRGKPAGALSKFLLTRGLWLIFLELTVIFFGWTFLPPFGVAFLQVIWAIGVSMVILSGIVFAPIGAVAAFGIILVVGHNLFDGYGPAPYTPAANAVDALLMFLHSPGFIGAPFQGPFIAYPIVPWVGVMALGFVSADIFRWEAQQRKKWLIAAGAAMILGFFILRGFNIYGDPKPWTTLDAPLKTAMSFFDVMKYPPSLQFLLATLGPAAILLALAENWRGGICDAIVVFGRVPLFFYVIHIYAAHLVGVALAMAQGYKFSQSLILIFNAPEGFGVGLAGVYAFWAIVVLGLYPACKWFAGVKKRSRKWWMYYF